MVRTFQNSAKKWNQMDRRFGAVFMTDFTQPITRSGKRKHYGFYSSRTTSAVFGNTRRLEVILRIMKRRMAHERLCGKATVRFKPIKGKNNRTIGSLQTDRRIDGRWVKNKI